MPAGIAITNTDHTIDDIRVLACKCKDSRQARRLRALGRVMEGELDRGTIASRARVGRQTLRDWIIRYNAEGPGGLKDRPRRGRSPKLDAGQRAEIGRWLESGPGPGIPVWTLGLLKERIGTVFDTVMSLEAVRCMVRALGFRKMSARPLHPKADPHRQEEFRHEFSRLAADSLPGDVSPGDGISRTRRELARRACRAGYGHAGECGPGCPGITATAIATCSAPSVPKPAARPAMSAARPIPTR